MGIIQKTLRLASLTFLFLGAFAAFPRPLSAFTDGQSADQVVGFQTFTQNASYRADTLANTFYHPYRVYSDGTHLFVNDSQNSRVVFFNSPPATWNTGADLVLGLCDINSGMAANRGPQAGEGPASSNSLSTNLGSYYDGTRFYVADTSNNRVLIFNGLPGSSGTSASVVVGQTGFTTTSANQGSANPTIHTLNAPGGVYSDGTHLYIADSSNNRVLFFNSIPVTNNAPADFIIGQALSTTKTANQGLAAPTSQTLSNPQYVYGAGTTLIVVDRGNNRVLVFNSAPVSNNAPADSVVGQLNMTTGTANQGGSTSASSLASPSQAILLNGNLWVADAGNDRVLEYAGLPSGTGASATLVVGQTDLNSNLVDSGIGTNSRGLNTPDGVAGDGTRLYVSDFNNNRVMVFDSMPVTNNTPADFVLGQPDFNSNLANQRGVTKDAWNLSIPSGVAYDGTYLYVADQSGGRVLMYPGLPDSNGVTAIRVVGQANFTAFSSTISASVLNGPFGVAADGTKLFVSDAGQNRVLIYNNVPSYNGAPADVVVGQASMGTSLVNQGGVPGANTLDFPTALLRVGAKLLVADSLNNRVLVFNNVPAGPNAAADVVIGQTGMGVTAANQGLSAPTSQTLNQPVGLYWSGNKLYICDPGNNRVLVYNSIPVTNNAPADLVLGQTSMTAALANQGGTATGYTLKGPLGVGGDGVRIFVADTGNHRVLEFDSEPTGLDPSADHVLGQTGLTNSSRLRTGYGTCPDPGNFSSPYALAGIGNALVVADTVDNRVLVFHDAGLPSPTPTATFSPTSSPTITPTPLAGPGANWYLSDPAFPPNSIGGKYGSSAVEFNGSLWLVGGEGGVSDQEVWNSVDGTNWTLVTTAPFPGRAWQTLTVFNGQLWVIAGYDQATGALADVWSSPDGSHWTEQTAGAFPARSGHVSFVFNGKLWVVGGYSTAGGYLNDVWNSPNGVNWTKVRANADFSPRYNFGAAVLNGAVYVVGGVTGGPAGSDVWKSTDGVTWIQLASSSLFGPREEFGLLVYGGRMWLIGGYDFSNDHNDVWSSSDGVSWNEETAAASFSIRDSFGSAVFSNRLWVLGGFPNRSDIWYSPQLPATSTPTLTSTSTASQTPTDSPTPSPTDSPTPTSTDTPTESPADSATDSPTSTATLSPTDSPILTSTDTPTESPTDSATDSPTSTVTLSPTDSATSTATDSPSATPTDSATWTPTDSPTRTASSTATDTGTDTATPTPTDSPTSTVSQTPTSTATDTPTDTGTDTPSATATDTGTDTATPTPTDSPTSTASQTPTSTASRTSTDTATRTASSTGTDTATSTPTSTVTDTPVFSYTPTSTATDTGTDTPTDTATDSATPTVTNSTTPTPSATLTATPSASPTTTPTD
ncbi:MAG TPA: kelch repeat-containing protein, partial [bacterium]|nr:kelch repeat-containing protein [bacterium]